MMRIRLLLALACVVLAAGGVWADVYKAPFPEPTAEETLILEYINRARADPAAEARRILESGERIPSDVDKAMFEREMAALPPAPPLVFNLQLLDAARKHAHYMILNEQSHDQVEGRPGFTGKSMGDRIRAAGYRGSSMAENAFKTARNAWNSHVAFEVDWGPGGAGGMQPGRGHRVNIHNPGYRELGAGAVPHGSQFSVIHNFGSRKVRLAGGVAYFDKNNNGFYDIGEGRGGVGISVQGGGAVKTWDSGAFALEIPSNQAVSLTAEYDGLRFSRQYPASGDNIKFDFVIPARHDIQKAERLADAVERTVVKEGDVNGARALRRAQLRLHADTQSLYLDDATRERIEALTKDALAAMAELRDGITKLMDDGVVIEARQTIHAARQDYRGTPFDDWLADAYASSSLLDQQLKLAAPAKEGRAVPASQVRNTVRTFERQRDTLKTEFWREWVGGLIERTAALADEQA